MHSQPVAVVDGLWEQLATEASAESSLWRDLLLPPADQAREPVFSPLGHPSHALALETIYEGYLAHYGRPRLFAPPDEGTALLLGDYLYAHGLVRIAAAGGRAEVADLAELISLCAQTRADGLLLEAPAWAATAALLGRSGLDVARDALRRRRDSGPLELLAREAAGDAAVERALAAHDRFVG